VARTFALVSICFALAGCELVADFDRSKIAQPDARVPAPGDASLPPVVGMDAAIGPRDGGVAADAGDDDAGALDLDAGR
jgi:hypothetical protein